MERDAQGQHGGEPDQATTEKVTSGSEVGSKGLGAMKNLRTCVLASSKLSPPMSIRAFGLLVALLLAAGILDADWTSEPLGEAGALGSVVEVEEEREAKVSHVGKPSPSRQGHKEARRGSPSMDSQHS